MARFFDDGSSESLTVNSTPVTATPLTLSCWINPDDLGDIFEMGMTVIDASASYSFFGIGIHGWEAGNPVVFTADGDEGADNLLTSTGIGATNVWHHACGVSAAIDDRRVYLDGGGKNTSAVTMTPSGLDRISIGAAEGGGTASVFSGAVAEVSAWNVALTDAEVAVLGAGYSPLFIRPQSLVLYAPLIRDEDYDRVGGLSFTANNTPTIAPHPPVIYPAPVMVPSIGEAGRTTKNTDPYGLGMAIGISRTFKVHG